MDLALHALAMAAAHGADERVAVSANVAEGLEPAAVVDDDYRPTGDHAGEPVSRLGNFGGEAEEIPAETEDSHLLAFEPRRVGIRLRFEDVIKFAGEVEHYLENPYCLISRLDSARMINVLSGVSLSSVLKLVRSLPADSRNDLRLISINARPTQKWDDCLHCFCSVLTGIDEQFLRPTR